ncbi:MULTISPECIES: hypothetical protein [unclassified Streptomyces]|uniref:Lipoprotein n=2 Tax=Streptomyces TaxID=1883 RepID=A0AB39YIT7_9ACTN|nr:MULTISPECIES: hypothetical protein [unclassified Streptomyces]KJY45935.1 hypothetical protein VR46_11960 [Streptomyces sp. NRRL S-444]KOY57946.1 hypothetical protein ADK59_11285 [Streptomyces sp. XY332]THA36042.1 hypothetical protein E6W17_25930 [Streptomyces sp. A1547]
MDDSSSRSSTTRRRMRSGSVALGGMGLLAAALVACGSSSEPDKRCVDRATLEKLNTKECKSGSSRGAYYYGGTVANNRVSGGSFDKSAVTRGGIGGHSSSSGG